MFKGKIRIYKNANGKEEEIRKEFDDETAFNEFVQKNPDLQNLWKPLKWPSFSLLEDSYFEAERNNDRGFFDRVEEELRELAQKAKRLIEK